MRQTRVGVGPTQTSRSLAVCEFQCAVETSRETKHRLEVFVGDMTTDAVPTDWTGQAFLLEGTVIEMIFAGEGGIHDCMSIG